MTLIIEHAHKSYDDLYQKIDQKTGPAMAGLTGPTPTALLMKSILGVVVAILLSIYTEILGEYLCQISILLVRCG